MGELFSLLSGELAGDVGGTLGRIKQYVGVAMAVLLGICGMLVTFYAVWIGYKFATSKDDGARANAKSQLIYALVGVLSIVIVIVLFQAVIPAVTPDPLTNVPEELAVAGQVYGYIGDVATILMQILTSVAVVFAIYVGWQFMKADDDAKRKNAKSQLIYTCIGIVGMVLITAIIGPVMQALKNRAQMG